MRARESILPNGVGRDPTKTAAEEALEVRLPLRNEVSWTDNQRSPDETQALHLSEVEPPHNGLSGARLIREQEPQERLRKHRAIDCAVLMGVWTQGGRRERGSRGGLSGTSHPLRPQRSEYLGGLGAAIFREGNHRSD